LAVGGFKVHPPSTPLQLLFSNDRTLNEGRSNRHPLKVLIFFFMGWHPSPILFFLDFPFYPGRSIISGLGRPSCGFVVRAGRFIFSHRPQAGFSVLLSSLYSELGSLAAESLGRS